MGRWSQCSGLHVTQRSSKTSNDPFINKITSRSQSNLYLTLIAIREVVLFSSLTPRNLVINYYSITARFLSTSVFWQEYAIELRSFQQCPNYNYWESRSAWECVLIADLAHFSWYQLRCNFGHKQHRPEFSIGANLSHHLPILPMRANSKLNTKLLLTFASC